MNLKLSSMKKFIIYTVLVFFGTVMHAQDDRTDRVESAKKEYIIKELQLTDAEAAAFFPIYKEYNQKRKEARKSMREAKSEDASVERLMDAEQNMVDIQKGYMDRFKSVLPERKVIQLIEAEKKFKLMLMQKLKD